MRPLPILLLATLLLPLACKPAPAPEPPEGGGGAAASPEPPPPPPPEEAPFQAEAIDAGGGRTALDVEGETTIPAPVAFELQSNIAFRTVRVRILDGRDRLVPSRDEIRIGQGTRVRLEPEAPLEANGTYELRIDAATGSGPVDVEDRTWLSRRIRFSVLPPDEGGGGGRP